MNGQQMSEQTKTETETTRVKVRFAAAAAAAAFRTAGWTWGEAEQPPSVQEIEKTLLMLIEHARGQEPDSSTGTGRLTVSIDRDGDIYLGLDIGTIYEGSLVE